MEALHGVQFITTAEAAERLGDDVTTANIRDWVRRGLLHPAGRHNGRSWIFKWDDVLDVEMKTRTSRRGRPRRAGMSLPKLVNGCTISTDMGAVDPAQNREDGRRELPITPLADAPLVYYLLFGDRIKIGYTRNLQQRLTKIPHDEVLAYEPGGEELEKFRHRQFAAQRIYRNREWFWVHPDLMSHVRMLTEHFGLQPARP